MKESKCWVDVTGKPHLDKKTCISADMTQFLTTGYGEGIEADFVTQFILENKDKFLEFLNEYGVEEPITKVSITTGAER